MRKLRIFMMMMVAFFIPIVVQASASDMQAITNEQELRECVKNVGFCKLESDISLQSVLTITRDVYLDLNGKVISPNSELEKKGGLVLVNHGAKLTISDSKGKGKISTGTKEDSNVWGGIELANDGDSNKVAELVVNGGTIEGYYYGVVGNGDSNNTKITINDGTISGLKEKDSLGVYHPQIGEMTVNGGVITGGTGIEMRSGTLVVNSGKIAGTALEFMKVITSDGSTTNGVGITVAQHTTKQPIKVIIKGGDISGQYAFYEWNPHKNNEEDISKIKIEISGGNFVGTADGVSTVYSEDFTKFISGGKFNKDVSKYSTDNAKIASKNIESIENMENKGEKSGKSGWLFWSLILAIFGIGGFVLYKKIR